MPNWSACAVECKQPRNTSEDVLFPSSQVEVPDPLAGLTVRQKLACALRFYGDSSGPLPLKLIGLRMGIKRAAVCRLIARGAARIRANGYEIASLGARASAA